VIRFLTQQYRYGCRAGFGRREAMSRALRIYIAGF
jgi:hypothetical protein